MKTQQEPTLEPPKVWIFAISHPICTWSMHARETKERHSQEPWVYGCVLIFCFEALTGMPVVGFWVRTVGKLTRRACGTRFSLFPFKEIAERSRDIWCMMSLHFPNGVSGDRANWKPVQVRPWRGFWQVPATCQLTLSRAGFFGAPVGRGGGGTKCPLVKTLFPVSESTQVKFFWKLVQNWVLWGKLGFHGNHGYGFKVVHSFQIFD